MVSAAQNYAPYGAPFGTVGTFASPYAYTGEYTDPSGQVYLRARYYNPTIGTFTALDPVMGVAAVPMSLNGYSYVHNNPVNWTDPSGEFLPVIAVIGLGILGGAVGGALLGGGIEAGSQLLNNGFDLGCLDMDSVGRAALEGAALGALAGGVGAAVGAAGLSGAAAFAVSEGADFIGGFLYDIGVNGLSREQALINGLMGIGFGGAIGLLGRGLSRAARRSGLLDRVPRSTPAPSRICPASFSADTLIATPDGDKPISEIEVGDVILAYSEATEEVDIYHVSATHTQHHETTLDVTIDGETLHTTDEHPFYVIRDNEEQWVEAKHLQADDRVLAADGTLGVVEAIEIVDKPQTMYNLTVALVATYMVGDGQWVVHNQNCDDISGAKTRILELFSGPVPQMNRSIPGYRLHESTVITADIRTYGNPHIIVADATNLRFQSDSFDEVFFTNPFSEGLRDASFDELEKFRTLIYSEASRVLAPGGHLFVSFAGNNKYAKILGGNAKLLPEFVQLGFSVVKPSVPYKRSEVYSILHPALRGGSFGRPDGDVNLGGWPDEVMRTLTLALGG